MEPGSNWSVKMWLYWFFTSEALTLFGSTDGYSAAARILPVATSTTVIVPRCAAMFCTSSAISCCRYHCRSRLIVSCRVPPSTAGCCTSVPGITTPSLPFWNVRVPFSARRQSFWVCSMPASGSPSIPMNPTRLPATAPSG